MGVSGGSTSLGIWLPADHGLIAWTFDPASNVAGSGPTSGVLQLARIHLPTARSITNVILNVVSAGVALTSGQCFAGLWTSAGAKIDVTADQSGSWNSGGNKIMALSQGAYAASAGDYYVGWWSNAGTSNPTFARQGSSTLVNVGLSAPSLRFATADTGLTNAASAPSSLGTQSASSTGWFAALS
jgi:hypothetical protein